MIETFAHVCLTDKNYTPIRSYAFNIKYVSLKEFMTLEENALKLISLNNIEILQVFLSKNLGLIVEGKN